MRDSKEHELSSFWLRKTGKAVLAVLLTRKPDGTCTYWRGMNVEVSMPTGTLCAERNAIGNALAADQSIERADMQAVAVLSVSLDPQSEPHPDESTLEIGEVAMNPLDPCGAWCVRRVRRGAHPCDHVRVSNASPFGARAQHGVAQKDLRGQPRLQGAYLHLDQL